MRLSGRVALLAVPTLAMWPFISAHAESAMRIAPPALETAAPADGLQIAVVAGGCFWGIQAVYQHTKGVTNAVSGYAGGEKKDAEYDTVGSGRTRHAEAVQVTFDPVVVSYGKILQIFFSVAHNPTELDRQGAGCGPSIPLRDFPAERRAAQNRQSLYCPTRRRENIPQADRD
jgi:peptide-methionine (S)-S-oxide reductase